MTAGKDVIDLGYSDNSGYKEMEKNMEEASIGRTQQEHTNQAEGILDIENGYDEDKYNEIDNEEPLEF